MTEVERFPTLAEAEDFKTRWLASYGAEPGGWNPYNASAYITEDPIDGAFENRFRVVCSRRDSCD